MESIIDMVAVPPCDILWTLTVEFIIGKLVGKCALVTSPTGFELLILITGYDRKKKQNVVLTYQPEICF